LPSLRSGHKGGLNVPLKPQPPSVDLRMGFITDCGGMPKEQIIAIRQLA